MLDSNVLLVDYSGLSAFWSEAHSAIRSEIDAAAFSGEMPDLTGYLSQQDLSEYRTESQISSMIAASLPNMANYVSDSDMPVYLNEYRTYSQIQSMIASSISAIPATDLTDYISITDMANYRTYSQIQSMITTSLSEYRTSSQINDMIDIKTGQFMSVADMSSAIAASVVNYRTEEQIASMIELSLFDYATVAAVSSMLTSSLAGYYNSGEAELAMQSMLSNYRTYEQIYSMINGQLADYSTYSQVKAMIEASIPDMTGYLSQQDLSEYRTESQIQSMITSYVVDQTGYVTQEQLSDYRTESQIQSMINASMPDLTGYLTQDSLSNYRTESQIQSMINASMPDLTGYLTSDSLADYRTETQIQSMIDASMPNMENYLSSDALANYRTETQIRSLIDAYNYVTYAQASSMISNGTANIKTNPVVQVNGPSWNYQYSSKAIAVLPGAYYKRSDFDDDEIDLISAKFVGEETFREASGITYAQIPNADYIGSYAFYSCSTLTSLNLYRVRDIGDYAFAYCENLSADIGNNTWCPNYIGKWAFGYCSSISSINLYYCKYVDDYAFTNCTGLSSGLVAANMVEYIGQGAFNGCTTLRGLTTMNNIRRIEANAFRGCSSLYYLGGIQNVEYIGSNAFRGTMISQLDFTNATHIPWLADVNAFYSTPLMYSAGTAGYSYSHQCYIRVPGSLYSDWITAPNWSQISSRIFANDIAIASAVKWTSPTGNPIVDQYVDKYRAMRANGVLIEGMNVSTNTSAYAYIEAQSVVTPPLKSSNMVTMTNASNVNLTMALSNFTDSRNRFFTNVASFSDTLFQYAPSLMVFYGSSLYFSSPINTNVSSGTGEPNITVVFPNLTSISRGFTTTGRLLSNADTILSVFVPKSMYSVIANDAGLGGNIYHCLYSF